MAAKCRRKMSNMVNSIFVVVGPNSGIVWALIVRLEFRLSPESASAIPASARKIAELLAETRAFHLHIQRDIYTPGQKSRSGNYDRGRFIRYRFNCDALVFSFWDLCLVARGSAPARGAKAWAWLLGNRPLQPWQREPGALPSQFSKTRMRTQSVPKLEIFDKIVNFILLIYFSTIGERFRLFQAVGNAFFRNYNINIYLFIHN